MKVLIEFKFDSMNEHAAINARPKIWRVVDLNTNGCIDEVYLISRI